MDVTSVPIHGAEIPTIGGRQRIVGVIVLGVGVLFLLRLFQMQVTTDEYKNRAERLTEEQEILQPARGLCLDRHGELLVNNVPSYDLMVVPRYMANIDTSALANLLNLERSDLDMRLERVHGDTRDTRRRPLLRQLNASEYAALSAELWRYPGLSFAPSPSVKMCLASQAKSWASTVRSTVKT